MNAGINTSFQPIHPGVIQLNPGDVRRQRDFHDLQEQAGESRSDTGNPRRVESVSPADSSFDATLADQKFRFQRIRDKQDGPEAVSNATSAGMLSQMIHKMGGSGTYVGPGRVFNILV